MKLVLFTLLPATVYGGSHLCESLFLDNGETAADGKEPCGTADTVVQTGVECADAGGCVKATDEAACCKAATTTTEAPAKKNDTDNSTDGAQAKNVMLVAVATAGLVTITC